MASRSLVELAVSFDVTLRFDLFYSLRALDEGSEIFDDWQNSTERALPRDFLRIAKQVAPRPMMWPLLADCLRDAPSVGTFADVLEMIRSLDDKDFQRAVLSGVFRDLTIVDDLISKRRTLRETGSAGYAAREGKCCAAHGQRRWGWSSSSSMSW